jgi:hypothetical protein
MQRMTHDRKSLTHDLAGIGIGILLASIGFANAQSLPALGETFNLGVKHTQSPQFFVMESKLILYALDGKRVGTDIYRLHLKCNPAQAANDGDQYTCAQFTWQANGGAEVGIPSLTNWTYVFKAAGDKKGQMFGIDRTKFDRLADSTGKTLPADKAYHVYNAFIDFHSFCNIFAEPAGQGRGIQDLKKIGDKIVHFAAFSEPPVGPGGSFFKNGEITLEFKGLSQIGGKSCALVGYDSGASSFKMIIKPAPELNQTVGSSHYFGDIHKELASGWVQKATMTEIVVSETTLSTPPNKVNAVIERLIEIRNVGQKEFGL